MSFKLRKLAANMNLIKNMVIIKNMVRAMENRNSKEIKPLTKP